VEVSLNGVDFSTSVPPVRFEYYDNWIVPRLGLGVGVGVGVRDRVRVRVRVS